MGVTLYSNIDYKGDSITENIFGVHDEMQPGWRDEVDSVKIEPDDAYEWCGWQHKYQQGDFKCYTTSKNKFIFADDISHQNYYSSRSIKKLCDHDIHKWDEDCINANDKVAIGNCDIDSKCWNNQKNECKNPNIITTDLRCKDWCIKYPNECNKISLDEPIKPVEAVKPVEPEKTVEPDEPINYKLIGLIILCIFVFIIGFIILRKKNNFGPPPGYINT